MKKTVALLAAVSLMAGSSAFASRTGGEDTVTLIVELRGEAVLENENAKRMGAALFCETDEASADTERIMKIHEAAEASIIEAAPEAEIGYTYTHAFNGLSVDIKESDIDKIKAIPEIYKVFVSQTYSASDPIALSDAVSFENGGTMMNLEYMRDNGITGKGMVIAVIDDGFDLNHEYFTGDIDASAVKYSKADIASLISTKTLSAGASDNLAVNRVYKNAKIPFAFDYDTRTSDTFNAYNSHGTHVAGIAAGNNGTAPDGSRITGAAPDAQLILLSSTMLRDDSLLAAVDDAVKLGADVINASWGEPYMETSEAVQTAVSTVSEAGIFFAVSAGNEGRANYGSENIDYGTMGIPACISPVTAVASVGNTKYWRYNSSLRKYEIVETSPVSMNSFSSWGTTSSLELKPEITAPGGIVYSSVNNDGYGYKSGTSMASPYMAGAAALMRQYIRENKAEKYNDISEEESAALAENLFMTTAKVLIQNEAKNIPYSPRLQGAGMADAAAAAKTPVILLSDGHDSESCLGKAKISLGEISDEFSLEFYAKNYSRSPVTYDDISLKVITDSADAATGKIGNMKALTFTAEDIADITVPAGGETKITIPVTLDKDECDENMQLFKNGFFVDGYVFMKQTAQTVPDISIPFMGFYGEWKAAPTLDKPYFSGKSQINQTYIAGASARNAKGQGDRELKFLGKNIYAAGKSDYSDYESEGFVGVSPNGDNEADYPCGIIMPFRRTGKTVFSIYDENERLRAEKTDVDSSDNSLYYTDKFTKSYLSFDTNDITALEDGDYTFRVNSGFFRDGSEGTESISMKFYIDREVPEITAFELREEGERTYLDITAQDNRHLMAFTVSGKCDDADFFEAEPVKGLNTASASFDITGVDLETLSAEAVDYAFNSSRRTVSGLEISYGGNIVGDKSTGFVFNIRNTSGKAINSDVIMALYNDGILSGIKITSDPIPEGNSVKIFNTEIIPYDSIKLFVWDKTENMKPLYDRYDF